MTKVLKPSGKLCSLVEKYIMSGRNDEYRRELRQCFITDQAHGYQRITRIPGRIRLIECFQKVSIITIPPGILFQDEVTSVKSFVTG